MKYAVGMLLGAQTAYWYDDPPRGWAWTTQPETATLLTRREDAQLIIDGCPDLDAWIEEVPDTEAFVKRNEPLL